MLLMAHNGSLDSTLRLARQGTYEAHANAFPELILFLGVFYSWRFLFLFLALATGGKFIFLVDGWEVDTRKPVNKFFLQFSLRVSSQGLVL